jgi:hypothetical protein
MIIFNEVSEDIVEEKHVCYFTKDQSLEIELYEVFEKKLFHPKVKEHAFVYKFDTRKIGSFYRTELDSAASILLEAAQNNIRKNKEKQ